MVRQGRRERARTAVVCGIGGHAAEEGRNELAGQVLGCGFVSAELGGELVEGNRAEDLLRGVHERSFRWQAAALTVRFV